MKTRSGNKILLATVFALNIIGLVVILSASVVVSYNNFGNNYYYFSHQLIYGFLLGIALMFLFYKIDYHIFRKYGALFLFATIFLLAIVFIPGFGHELKGASRWVVVGGINFQPSEMAKLTFILYLASWFEKKGKDVTDISQGLASFIVIISVVSLFLIKQPDVSTLMVIAAAAITMYFMAGAKMSHMIFVIMSGVGAVLLLIKIAPYRMDRFMVFLHPELDPKGIGYQINQALLALGSGGFFGVGLGHSRQKFNYLPESIGDSVFAIAGEELGMIGLLMILSLFFIFAMEGFKIANRAPDPYGRLLAVGITSWITFQALMNMAAITSLIPLTGIPLPFISYGGTALVTSLAAMGILLNVSKYGK